MEKIVVIGTGTMAGGIGAGFIAAGFEVVFLGRTLDRATASLATAHNLAAGLAAGGGAASGTGARVAAPGASAVAPGASLVAPGGAGLIDTWNDWSGVVWVLETVAEDFDLKRQLFAALDARVPAGVPLGSNSSGFPITRIAAGLATRRRMFNAHYFMPAHLVPLVEVALGVDSDPALGEAVCALYRRAGKKPVLVRQDIPGFLANRIQHALMREALDLIDRGIATPDDVDAAVRYSFGFRYAACGPMMQKEISGWDSMARAAAEIYPSLSNTHVLSRCVDGIIKAGKTGMKAGAGFTEWPAALAAGERSAYDRRLKAAFDVLNMDGKV